MAELKVPNDSWDEQIDPWEEIENLRDALMKALVRETKKKRDIINLRARIKELNEMVEAGVCSGASTCEAFALSRVAPSCPRCTGATTLYGGVAMCCEACKREEEIEKLRKELTGLRERVKRVPGVTLCPRCEGPSMKYGGLPMVCSACTREEEYELA